MNDEWFDLLVLGGPVALALAFLIWCYAHSDR
jgi:hypothetical protein